MKFLNCYIPHCAQFYRSHSILKREEIRFYGNGKSYLVASHAVCRLLIPENAIAENPEAPQFGNIKHFVCILGPSVIPFRDRASRDTVTYYRFKAAIKINGRDFPDHNRPTRTAADVGGKVSGKRRNFWRLVPAGIFRSSRRPIFHAGFCGPDANGLCNPSCSCQRVTLTCILFQQCKVVRKIFSHAEFSTAGCS